MKNTITGLLIVLSLFLMAAMVQGAVVINEVMPSPSVGNDWIELYNDGPNDDSLDSWSIKDGNSVIHTFGENDVIAAGGYIFVEVTNRLNRDGDVVILRDGTDAEIDAVTYGDVNDPADAPHLDEPLTDESLARVHNGYAQWVISNQPTPDTSNNRQPFSNDATFVATEDTDFVFAEEDFTFVDADDDILTALTIVSVPVAGSLQLNGVAVAAGREISSEDLANGEFVFVPAANENGAGYTSFDFTVGDGIGNSEDAYTATIDVDAVNDAPVITGITRPRGTFVESEHFDFEVIATDIDSAQGVLFVDVDASSVNGAPLSDIDWVDVDDAAGADEEDADLGLEFEDLPAGLLSVQLVVSDGDSLSMAEVFEFNIKPALEIVADSVLVTVNGNIPSIEVDGERNPIIEVDSVSPGDEVAVTFDYINNLDGRILGNVQINAESDENPDFVDHQTSHWALLPQRATAYTFRFVVPLGQMRDFRVDLDVEDENQFGERFGDSVLLDFNLEREPRDVVVQSISLQDTNLTCTRVTNVDYTFINTGRNDVAPELFLFNGRATMDANGDFDRAPEFGRHPLPEVQAGESADGTVPDVNFGSLPAGGRTIFAYIVSPFFWNEEEGFTQPEPVQIPVTVGSCLNTSALEEEFAFAKNERDAKSVDLFAKTEPDAEGNQHYLFINEDFSAELNYEGTLEFSIPEGEENTQNTQLIDNCAIEQSTITCAAPNRDEVGQSPVTIRVREAAALGEAVSDLSESFLARVRSGMEISNLQINGQSEAQVRDNGLTLRPAQDMVLSFRVQNTLAERLTNVVALVRDNNIEDEVEFAFEPLTVGHLNAAETSSTKTMTLRIPADVPAGDYDLQMEVTAQTLGDERHRDTVPFTIHVQPALSEILLSAELRLPEEAENTITCAATVPVHLEYTNTGSVDENDVAILVKERGEIKWDSRKPEDRAPGGPIVIPKGGVPQPLDIPLEVQGIGRHTFSVELLYNFAGDVAGSSAAPVSVTVTKNGCLDAITASGADVEPFPVENGDSIVVGPGSETEFGISLAEEVGDENLIQWFVAEEGENFPEETTETGATFTYTADNAGEFNIKVVYNEDAQDSVQWTMFVTEVPISVTGALTTNIPPEAEVGVLEEFPDFLAENSHGEIAFSQPVNLRGILNLEDYIFIGSGIVSVVGTEENEDRFGAATITVKNVQPGKTVIYKYDDFTFDGDVSDLGERRICTQEEGCQLVSHNGGDFVFTVTGFSTYQVVTERESALDITPAEITLENVDRGTTITTDFRLRNSGTLDAVTGLRYDLSSFAAKYTAAFTQAPPTSLDPQEEITITLRLTVPANEDAGLHRIGVIKINSDQVAEKQLPVSLNTKTFLKIDSVKVNGKASGDLVLDGINKIEVEVKNELTKDMEDVTVTVEILDVNDDDLEEESDSFDIGDNDKEKVTLEFDLRGEEVDEEEFDVKITAEGDAEDGSSHKVVETRKVKVKREKHKVIIDSASLTSETLDCLSQTTLSVTVENIGKSDEDNVAIKVRNSALKVDLNRDNIELEKFDDNDNRQRETFTLNVPDATPGTYPITVELYRDGNIVDTKELSLTIKGCAVTRTQDVSQRTLSSDDELARQLQQQLENQLRAQQQQLEQARTTVTTSFRESNTYTMLLGLLVLLVFVALALGIAVMVKRK